MKTKLPSLVSILILTLLTSVLWVSLSVYRALTTRPEPPIDSEILNPLTPTLDQDTIEKIRSRLFFDESQIPENVVTAPQAEQVAVTSVPSPTSTSTPTPTTTPTAPPEEPETI